MLIGCMGLGKDFRPVFCKKTIKWPFFNVYCMGLTAVVKHVKTAACTERGTVSYRIWWAAGNTHIVK